MELPGRRVVDMAASSQQVIDVEMPRGVPYKYHPDYPTNYVYALSITNTTGFVPFFENGTPDNRFLGVMVRLVPQYGAPQ